MRTALLILHPRAHRHRDCPQLLDHLSQQFDLKIVASEYAGHTGSLVKEYAREGDGLVFTAGGDGTINEALNGWAESGFQSHLRFCPLPLGTGNDLLASIDPRLQKTQTFLHSSLSREIDADVGRVTYRNEAEIGHRYFCVGATAGFSAQVTQCRQEVANRLPGKLSYLYALVISFFFWKNRSMRVESEEGPLESQTFLNLNAANAKYYGGGMVSAPQADPFDGELDVVAMKLNLGQALLALPQNFRGDFHKVGGVDESRYRKAFTLTTEPPSPVQADGEVLGHTPMSVECLPGRLPLLLPSL